MKISSHKIVKVFWDDACDAAGTSEHVANYELLSTYNIGEIVGDKLDRINIRHNHCDDSCREQLEEPDEGITIPKGCITKIEVYKIDKVITYNSARKKQK